MSTPRDIPLGTTAMTGWMFDFDRVNYIKRKQLLPLVEAYLIAEAMEPVYRAMWRWALWPLGCCFNTSLILAPAIRMGIELDVRIVVGQVDEYGRHAWLETPDGTIIDPTFGMFDNGPHFRLLLPHDASRLGHWSEISLSLEQEEYFRQAITPRSGDDSWRIGSGVMEWLFSDHPNQKG